MTPLWLSILSIFVFSILVIFLKISIGGFETFITYGKGDLGLLFQSNHFNSYISSIHPEIYPNKIKGCGKNITNAQFKTIYQSYIVEIPHSYYIVIKRYIKHIDQMVNYRSIKNIPWRFAISKEGLEMDMPFTLDNYVILPNKLVENMVNNPYIIDKSIVKTLIHEKIHILQRNNQDRFNKFYISYFPNVRLFYGQIPETLLKKYMTNPDSNGIYFTYRKDGINYLPLLIVNNGYLSETGYNTIDYIGTINLSSIGFGYKQGLYHPNEILAYSISNNIVENIEIDLGIKEFLLSLN